MKSILHWSRIASMALAMLAVIQIPAPGQSGPTINQQPTNLSVVLGNDAAFYVSVSGTGPFSYQWRFNGTNLPNFIITIAGNGGAAFAGDGGPAVNASLNDPSGVALDAAGNLYVADGGNNRIRKVDTNGVITTVVGSDPGGYSGDGGWATNAALNFPASVRVDASGNLWIADTFNNRIRKVGTDGIIMTVAGNGIQAYGGDGGAATNASLNTPLNLVLSASGELYISEPGNSIVRKLATNGIITTFAGNRSADFAGDGGPALSASFNQPAGLAFDGWGNLLIGDFGNDRVRMVDTNGLVSTVAGNGVGAPQSGSYSGDGGAATNAGLNKPDGLAVDARGQVFVADTDNNVVRKIDTNHIIWTVAGTGAYGFSGDGQAATNAQMKYPYGVALDAAGNLFIADGYNNRVREVPAQGPVQTLYGVSAASAGNYDVVVTSPYGSVTSSIASLTILFPPSITVQPANQQVGVGGSTTLTVSNSGTPPFGYNWYFNNALLTSQSDAPLVLSSIDISNGGNYQVVVTNLYGSATSVVATVVVGYPPVVTNLPTTQFLLPGAGLTLSVGATGTGPLTYQWRLNGTNLPLGVISTLAGSGSGYPSGGAYSGDGGPATNARLNSPVGVALDGQGGLLIADTGNARIRKVASSGIITRLGGNGSASYSGDGGYATNAALNTPSGLQSDAAGNVFFADTLNNRVRIIATNGFISTYAGSGPVFPSPGGYAGDGGAATNARINRPWSVALDGAGNVLIADTSNSRIRRVGAGGIMSTIAGSGSAGFFGDAGYATNAGLSAPRNVAVDGNGNLYIADTGNQRIRKVDANGIISTVAGKGTQGFSGDGGSATNASLANPGGIAVDRAGNLIIADTGNHRVRLVSPDGMISTLAGRSAPGYFGDGNVATNANLANPSGLAVDEATGSLLVADTSNHRIRRIQFYRSEADTTHLNLDDIQSFGSGVYDVVVTSPYGSTTGTVATVTLVLSPQNLRLQLAGGSVQISFTGTPGYPYVLSSSTNLSLPVSWQGLVTNPAAIDGTWQFTDPDGPNWSSRFYRASPH